MMREGIFYFLLLLVVMAFFKCCDAAKCAEIENVSEKPTKFKVISGCYIHVDGRWIPRDSWRGEFEVDTHNKKLQ